MLTRQGLMKVKSKAVRNGIWFRVLSRAERAIVDLTMRCVEKVRSPILAKAITKILGKILKTLGKTFLEKAKEIGRDLAQRLSKVAEKWGNKKAPNWKNDKEFIKFLGVAALNT